MTNHKTCLVVACLLISQSCSSINQVDDFSESGAGSQTTGLVASIGEKCIQQEQSSRTRYFCPALIQDSVPYHCANGVELISVDGTIVSVAMTNGDASSQFFTSAITEFQTLGISIARDGITPPQDFNQATKKVGAPKYDVGDLATVAHIPFSITAFTSDSAYIQKNIVMIYVDVPVQGSIGTWQLESISVSRTCNSFSSATPLDNGEWEQNYPLVNPCGNDKWMNVHIRSGIRTDRVQAQFDQFAEAHPQTPADATTPLCSQTLGANKVSNHTGDYVTIAAWSNEVVGLGTPNICESLDYSERVEWESIAFNQPSKETFRARPTNLRLRWQTANPPPFNPGLISIECTNRN